METMRCPYSASGTSQSRQTIGIWMNNIFEPLMLQEQIACPGCGHLVILMPLQRYPDGYIYRIHPHTTDGRYL